MFFLSPEINCFFSEIGAGQEKTHVFFFGNALPNSNARAHLKQRKKHNQIMALGIVK